MSRSPLPPSQETLAEELETPKIAKISLEECQRVQTFCLLILTFLICCGAAYWLKTVLLPFVLALFLTLTLRPIVFYLTRRFHAPRLLAIGLTLCLGVALLVTLTAVVSSSIVELGEDIDLYERRFMILLDEVCRHPWLERFNFTSASLLTSIGAQAANSVGDAVAATFNALLALVSNIVLVAIYLVFLMFGSSLNVSAQRSNLFQDICQSIENYVLVKVLLSIIVGATTWLILSLWEVPMASVMGLLAFALNFIPNVGPIVAVILPLPLVLLAPGGASLSSLGAIIVLPTIVHMVIGHLIEPSVMGDSLELDPIVILLSLMLAGVIWGPVGMLLATPMTVAGKIMIDRVDWAKPIASLLSGRRPGHQARKARRLTQEPPPTPPLQPAPALVEVKAEVESLEVES